MAGPTSPDSVGPMEPPPRLPVGWVPQYDQNSKKYFFVQLATGKSQWEVPDEPAPAVADASGPADSGAAADGSTDTHAQLIRHEDGSETLKHADGTMEPLMPGQSPDVPVARDLSPAQRGFGPDEGDGSRGLGTIAVNQLVNHVTGGKVHYGGGSGSGGLLGGLTHGSGGLLGKLSGGGGGHQGGHQGGSHLPSASGLVGALASNLLSSKADKPQQPQNYHGGAQAGSTPHSGIAGQVFGGVANLMGGKPSSGNQNFGYSNSSHTGGYSAQAPPATYHAASAPPVSNLQNSPRPGESTGTQAAQAASAYDGAQASQHQAQQQPYNQYPPQQQYQQQQQQPPYAPYSPGHHDQQHGGYAGAPQYPPPPQTGTGRYGQDQFGQGNPHYSGSTGGVGYQPTQPGYGSPQGQHYGHPY